MHASCLCGEVSWDAAGPLEWISHCHCSRCRKAHGVGFATYGAAPVDRFRLAGREQLARWESSPGFFRCFCRGCGSVVPGDPQQGRVFMPVGNCEDDPGARPLAHIFTASKAPWYEITDALPRFDAFPPGIDAAVLPDRPPEDPPGATRGSCLCGAVAFRIEGEPLAARNCHCSRCRKERSAAHCANLFVAADGVRFTRGADQLASYKVPDARFFTHVFCRSCGGSLPRIDRERGFAVVPMGALDDDPGIKPQCHIFVASKPPWLDITDALPQYDEYPPS